MLPYMNDPVIKSRTQEGNKLIIVFKDTADRVTLDFSFTLKAVPVTDEQAKKVIYDYENCQTGIIAYEAKDVTPSWARQPEYEQYAAGISATLWTGKPFYKPDVTISSSSTFEYHVSPVAGDEGYFARDDLASKLLTLTIPGAYGTTGSLLEITKIRVYLPTDKVKLVDTDSLSSWLTKDLIAGEVKTDENGRKYQELTPNKDWLNNYSGSYYSGDLYTWNQSSHSVSKQIKFDLVSLDDPLDPDTTYTAPADMVVFYRQPEDTEDQMVSLAGTAPVITTKDVGYYEEADHAFNPLRHVHAHEEDLMVFEGEEIEREFFVSVFNSGDNTDDAIHMLPRYTGEAKQTFIFPYQIQPTKLYLYEGAASRDLNDNESGAASETPPKTKLLDVVYTTYEAPGTAVSVKETQTSSVITAINNVLNQNR